VAKKSQKVKLWPILKQNEFAKNVMKEEIINQLDLNLHGGGSGVYEKRNNRGHLCNFKGLLSNSSSLGYVCLCRSVTSMNQDMKERLIELQLGRLERQVEVEFKDVTKCFRRIIYYSGPRFNEYINRFLFISKRYNNGDNPSTE